MNLRHLAPLRLCVSLLLSIFLGVWGLQAAPPEWWSDGVTGGTPSPSSPANVGQLKNISKRAAEHLDENLPGGAGSEIWAMIDAWTVSTPDNFSPCNLAQAKATVRPFLDRLLSAGYDTKANWIARGYPSGWAYDYPWNPNTPASENMSPCGIAQLKMVFSFDAVGLAPSVLSDADADGLPDWWEVAVGGGTSGGALDDGDFDGIKNISELIASVDGGFIEPEDESSVDLRVFTQL